jgi:hypothetical protein
MLTWRTITILAATTLGAGAASAQEERTASGLAFWIRFPGTSVQEVAAATAGGPRFAVGVRRGRFQFGLGFGHAAARSSVRDSVLIPVPPPGTTVQREVEDQARATLFQIGPTVLADVWRSRDGTTRANITAGIGFGRVTLATTNEFVDFLNGEILADTTREAGGLIGFHLGFGGDHFLTRHFGIGAEAGYQGTAAVNLKDEDDEAVPPAPPPTRTSLRANGTYAALRVTLVF